MSIERDFYILLVGCAHDGTKGWLVSKANAKSNKVDTASCICGTSFGFKNFLIIYFF